MTTHLFTKLLRDITTCRCCFTTLSLIATPRHLAKVAINSVKFLHSTRHASLNPTEKPHQSAESDTAAMIVAPALLPKRQILCRLSNHRPVAGPPGNPVLPPHFHRVDRNRVETRVGRSPPPRLNPAWGSAPPPPREDVTMSSLEAAQWVVLSPFVAFVRIGQFVASLPH